jgi:predicted acylesterase/phospholipase RssA
MTMKDVGDQIGLALSGGGFRATLFHLGVVRFLFEVDRLKPVKLVSAVSGGSILAAHLILNWEKYTSSKGDFDAAAREVLNFVQADIRGRVLRRWMFGCLTIIPRFLLPKRWQWTLVNLLQRQYARLLRAPKQATTNSTGAATYREATIKDLRGVRPAVKFNCTSLTTGEPCFFNQAGFHWYKDGVIQPPMTALSLQVAYAVTASSAFPPLFPPVAISHETLSCDHRYFEHEQRLTDGGIYDNLGIEALIAEYKEGKSATKQQTPLETIIIISDAEGNFDSDFDTKYAYPVNRNVRASDLLMKRVSNLQLEDIEGKLKRTDREEEISFVRIKIRDSVRDLDDGTVLEPEAQRALINVRTDLDHFTPSEITALIAHGYSKAREALLDKNLVTSDAPKFTWNPLENWDDVKALPANKLQRSRLRKWRLWSFRDPISWFTGLYVLFIFLLLATPTFLLALQSSIEAQRGAEAKKAATIAQAGILAGAISQVQNLMLSMSQGCSGGAHGVPPLNWTNLQARGNQAVNALNNAKLALVTGETSVAVQQMNFAEGELDALVNGVHNNCSGGASGEDPSGFKSYILQRAAVKGNLNALQRSLGR